MLKRLICVVLVLACASQSFALRYPDSSYLVITKLTDGFDLKRCFTEDESQCAQVGFFTTEEVKQQLTDLADELDRWKPPHPKRNILQKAGTIVLMTAFAPFFVVGAAAAGLIFVIFHLGLFLSRFQRDTGEEADRSRQAGYWFALLPIAIFATPGFIVYDHWMELKGRDVHARRTDVARIRKSLQHIDMIMPGKTGRFEVPNSVFEQIYMSGAFAPTQRLP